MSDQARERRGASAFGSRVWRMTGLSSLLSVQVVDPRYGPGIDLDEREGASVDPHVESSSWSPREPVAATPEPLAFVDGAQRVEAWLTATEDDSPLPVVAVCFAVAVGGVLTVPGERARLVDGRILRGVIASGDRVLSLPPTDGVEWEHSTSGSRDVGSLHGGIARSRRRLEHEVAESLARQTLVVLDGRLSSIREGHGEVIGAIKSHSRLYLSGREADCITRLRVGQRTPLFSIGEDRLSWYQRLPGLGERGWAGILRGEVARSLGVSRASELADRAAGELPRFAGRPHRDPRAPQNLAPIGSLEDRLTHLMGDRRLALRAIRRATSRARLDGALQVEPPQTLAA